MGKAPIPAELEPFVQAPRPAVVGTVRPDGTPATAATWYGWEDGHLVLSMVAKGARARNLHNQPGVSLTILGESWYDHVTLLGRVVELRDDWRLVDLDQLSTRYTGDRYPKRELRCVTAIVAIERWHSWGDPAAQGSPPFPEGGPT